ncbi:MAG TPA: hypothetical protein VMZ25_07680 [Terriglobales bacterium]|nr:hypothetical protein [Terriglobales bacterium]
MTSSRFHFLRCALWLFAGAAFLAPRVQAEKIVLKNGRTILADSVRESPGRVEYTIGDSTFAIPRSSVVSIDTGGSPNVTRRDDLPEPPIIPKNEALGPEAEFIARIILNNRVDQSAITAIEAEGDSEKSAAANFIAAKHERTHGSAEKAERFIRRARTFLPTHENLMSHHVSILLQLGRNLDAKAIAEQLTRMVPSSATGFALLGYADLQLNKTKEAIRALKRSLELEPDPRTEELLQRAQRELDTEAQFLQDDSLHFALRYEGARAPTDLRRQILDTLERHYNDLVRDLGYAPRETISVSLYTDKQFFDVTRAAAWVGALNDGKLRLPINGITVVDSNLSRVLKHELTHSFINQMTRGRCPTWLNEGIAQLMEPRSASAEGRRLAALYGTQRNIPLNELEGSFLRFSAEEAAVAYAQSLISAEYIRDTYGMSDLAELLKRIGEGQSTESALRSTIHSGYAQFEQELTRHLQRSYGD